MRNASELRQLLLNCRSQFGWTLQDARRAGFSTEELVEAGFEGGVGVATPANAANNGANARSNANGRVNADSNANAPRLPQQLAVRSKATVVSTEGQVLDATAPHEFGSVAVVR